MNKATKRIWELSYEDYLTDVANLIADDDLRPFYQTQPSWELLQLQVSEVFKDWVSSSAEETTTDLKKGVSDENNEGIS